MTLVDLNINFDTDKAVIKDSYNSRIAEFAKMMNVIQKLKASIEAHTDSDGSNLQPKIIWKRAASTVKALKDLGVEESRIKAVGYGETKPVVSNTTKEGKAAKQKSWSCNE